MIRVVAQFESTGQRLPICRQLDQREGMLITTKPIPKLHRAPQPPLSYPGATPDSDRAKKPPPAEPSATDQELNPGDRVGGLANFGKPTGEFGTVEQANEDDAAVKWMMMVVPDSNNRRSRRCSSQQGWTDPPTVRQSHGFQRLASGHQKRSAEPKGGSKKSAPNSLPALG
jgi:hypothetical protein